MSMVSIKQSGRWLLGISIFLATITWAVFGQTLWHQFVNYDDPLYVFENPHVNAGLSWRGIVWAFTHTHSQNWHPLTTMSHMLDCQLFGLNPGWHHFMNVLLHSAAVVVLFLALNRATGAIWASACVAVIFAIHPLRVESVAWISERKDVLSGLFFMLTLLAYVGYARQPSLRRYLATSLLFACGLMSKPMIVSLPIVLLLLDYWPLGRSSSLGGQLSFAKLLGEKIPLFVLAIGSGVATVMAQNFALGSTEFLPIAWRATNAVVSYFEYVRQMFWPVGLIPFYVHPENRLPGSQLLAATVVLIGISAIAIFRRRQNPYLFMGWCWYLVTLLPVIGLVQVGLQGHADRYTYLPQIGIAIAVVWLANDVTRSWTRQKFVLIVFGAAIVASLSFLAWKQTTYWRDTETLWTHALSVSPVNDVAHAGLAGILIVRGETDAAIEHYRQALALRDGNVAAQYGMAMALIRQRRFDPAIEHLRKVLSIQPDNVRAANFLGTLLAGNGDIANAVAAWRQVLAHDPDNVDAANNLAWVLATSDDSGMRNGQEALELMRHAIQFGGETPRLLLTSAAALAEMGRFGEAVETARRGEQLAEAQGDRTMAATLRKCLQILDRNEPVRGIQALQ